MDLAAHAFQTALSNMRELAEMAAKSRRKLSTSFRKRVEENLAVLRPPGTGE